MSVTIGGRKVLATGSVLLTDKQNVVIQTAVGPVTFDFSMVGGGGTDNNGQPVFGADFMGNTPWQVSAAAGVEAVRTVERRHAGSVLTYTLLELK